MDGKDVLKRALNLIREDKVLDTNDCQGGDNCPYCAISQAKTELDKEQGYLGCGMRDWLWSRSSHENWSEKGCGR